MNKDDKLKKFIEYKRKKILDIEKIKPLLLNDFQKYPKMEQTYNRSHLKKVMEFKYLRELLYERNRNQKEPRGASQSKGQNQMHRNA